jgi:hypothetical protein
LLRRVVGRLNNWAFDQPTALCINELVTSAMRAGPDHLLRLLRTIEDDYGHCQSARLGQSITKNGSPIPWYTYPAIDFLSQLDLRGWRVFEYGSGNSSKFFAGRVGEVISVEHDPQWYQTIAANTAANLQILLRPTESEYVAAIQEVGGNFDLIVIDGEWRLACATGALEHLAAGGMIILDNSDWFPNTARKFRDAGLLQIDFHGFGPINYYATTTSIFLRRDVRLLPLGAVQPLPPRGGLALVADAA